MFSKDEYVNYSTYGICRIEDIRWMKFDSGDAEREYYILKPLYQGNSSVFVPLDNPKRVERMRRVLSREEIDTLILSVKGKELDWISDHKKRSAQFREILAKRDEQELLLLIRALYMKNKEQKKGLTSGDAQVLKTATDIVAQEFSFALQIDPKNIGEYIGEHLA